MKVFDRIGTEGFQSAKGLRLTGEPHGATLAAFPTAVNA